MSIYFLRHVKTVSNDSGVLSGRADTDVIAGQELTSASQLPEVFWLVLSSPLGRCVKTLALLPDGICGRIVYTEKLLERDIGILEGMSRDRAVELYPELFDKRKLDVNADIPDGESIEQVRERTKEIVEYLRDIDEGRNILVCSHNQTLKIIYAALKSIEISNAYWQGFNFKNGEIVDISDLTFEP